MARAKPSKRKTAVARAGRRKPVGRGPGRDAAKRRAAARTGPPPGGEAAAASAAPREPAPRRLPPVVGMVASAGGLEAFRKFFQAMPPDNGLAFVLIPHLDPRRESLMAPLLAKYAAMPVVEAKEGVRVEPNRVYVIQKEELQSLNEELSTVNNQLQDKVEELESTNNDLANLLASTEIATLFLGTDSTIKRFTPAATRLFKLIATDVGRPLGDITVRFDDPALRSDIDAVLADLAPREKEVRSDDGRWYVRRITPYRTMDDRIEGVVVAFGDVSPLKQAEDGLRHIANDLEQRVAQRTAELEAEIGERRQAEETLRAERNFVSAVLGTAAALVIVLDREGRVVRFNKACEELSGYAPEELQGKTIWDALLVPEEADGVKRVFGELQKGAFPNRHENHWRHKDGSRRLIAWSNTCLLDARGQVEYAIGTGIDVTERRRAEGEARQRQLELAHLHRVHTAGELAAVLAHELNQPLAAIASYSDASLKQLQRGELPQDRLAQNLEHISAQAQRAGRVIRELRTFLAKDESTKAAMDLNAVVRRAAELVAIEARARGVQISLKLTDDLPAVTAADIQVEHTLVNLVRNGIEAIRDGGATAGTVTIETHAAGDGMATVTVRDSGPGLSPELVEKVFEPFYTTKRNGLGMGLRISRSVVESHGGRIWAEASTAGGIFHFTLPLAA